MQRILLTVALAGLALTSRTALADGPRDAILAGLAAEAKAADPTFSGFSAERGRAFWFAEHTGGKPGTTACTDCHTKDPTANGQTHAGKDLEPMAVSKTPDRFTDSEKVAKWFLRNCKTVLGRECTPAEKG